MRVLLFGILLLMQCADGQEKRPGRELPENTDLLTPIRTTENHKVIVGGHLYPLYTRSKFGRDQKLIHTEHIIEAFADQLLAIDPAATFILGDICRYARPREYAMVGRVFSRLKNPAFFLPGNHDYRNIEAFKAFGGVINKAVVINHNKYIMLDAKTIFEAHDLAFLRSQLADYQRFDHVFVLLNPRLLNRKPAPPGSDPYKPYSGTGNWNEEVVPLLWGKVRYVFVGDHYRLIAATTVRKFGEHEIRYFHISFPFRGEGPFVFLELDFKGRDFSVVPHIIALDLLDPWYVDAWRSREQMRLNGIQVVD